MRIQLHIRVHKCYYSTEVIIRDDFTTSLLAHDYAWCHGLLTNSILRDAYKYRLSINNHYIFRNSLPAIWYDIQIKIYAEYRDMLPRPRLFCQEPGLRPIGRSPGVPDKSGRGLGSMSRYSAQILICFIAYIFLFYFIPLGLAGNFAGLPVCTVPSAIVHCNQNEAGHQTIKTPSLPCWGAAGQSKHSLAF